MTLNYTECTNPGMSTSKNLAASRLGLEPRVARARVSIACIAMQTSVGIYYKSGNGNHVTMVTTMLAQRINDQCGFVTT